MRHVILSLQSWADLVATRCSTMGQKQPLRYVGRCGPPKIIFHELQSEIHTRQSAGAGVDLSVPVVKDVGTYGHTRKAVFELPVKAPMRNNHATSQHLHRRQVQHASRESDDPMALVAVMFELRESFGIQVRRGHVMGSCDNDRVDGGAIWFAILGNWEGLMRLIAEKVGFFQRQMLDRILLIPVGNSVRFFKHTPYQLDFNTCAGVWRDDEDAPRFLTRGSYRGRMFVDPVSLHRSERGSRHRVTRFASCHRGAHRFREAASIVPEDINKIYSEMMGAGTPHESGVVTCMRRLPGGGLE